MKKEAYDFLWMLKQNVEYWVRTGKECGYSTEEVCTGLVHSILANIDGCGMGNPIMMYKTDDCGEEATCINDEDELHELWYQVYKLKK